MEPRVHVITLAVEDLERSLAFYRDGLGFDSAGVVGAEFEDERTGAVGAIGMFNLAGGLIFTVYPRTELAKDAGVPLGPPKTGEFSIGHAVATRAEVDATLLRAEAAGATLLDKPHDRPWGIYFGYFQDPDGHLWEIMHNPALDLEAG
jgi:catechol 2,3-dioxygenase-like lactoylglutathione lyase family enzyme